MPRISLIALLSFIGAVAVMTGLAMYELVGVTPSTYLLIVIGSISDVLLDSICVALSLNAFSKQYQSLCSGCHSGLKWCCIKLADRTTGRKEVQLVAMHRQQSHHSPTTHTEEPTPVVQGQEEPTSDDQPPIPPAQSAKTQSAEMRLQRSHRTTSTMDLLEIVQGQQEPTSSQSTK